MLIVIGFWASVMPVLLRFLRLHTLLRLLTPSSRNGAASLQAVHRACRDDVHRAVRYTDLVLGHHPLVSRTCLLRSLILYRLLQAMGLPVFINFGVRQIGDALTGHTWLTPFQWPDVSLSSETDRFIVMYTFPQSGTESESKALPCV